jgi:hypothetical protein
LAQGIRKQLMALQSLQIKQSIAFKPGVKGFTSTGGLAPPLAPIPQKNAKPASHKMVKALWNTLRG